MLELTQINVFPVKSLDGYAVESAKVQTKGLQFDRRWMIADEKGVFLSQRTCRKLTGLRATVDGDTLRIASKVDPALHISLGIEEVEHSVQVKVWNDEVRALTVNKTADQFFSDFLGLKCQLVKMPDNSDRPIDPDYAKAGETLSFADGFPFLVIGEASLQDLNSRLKEKLHEPARRFRPNFVFSGGLPYAEDDWKDIKIGNVPFSGRKNCGRCVMITLDPDTGLATDEPLYTLSKYRKKGNSILMGQNLCFGQPGLRAESDWIVNVGDKIEIIALS